jgi:aspartate aminotransferase
MASLLIHLGNNMSQITSSMSSHILDSLSLGKIVVIRDVLVQQERQGKKVFRFESGDPNFSVQPHILEAIQEAGKKGKTHYIPNAGIPELRQALLQKMRQHNKIECPDPQGIFVTNGAMHALFIAFQSLLQPGDEVLVPDPMWTEVVENIKFARGVPVGVPLNKDNKFKYLASQLEAKITPATKAIFVNTPHNPTGAMLTASELHDIAKLAQKHNLWLISDEAYEDVTFDSVNHESIGSTLPEYHEKIISIFSFSKSFSMSGLRVGYFYCGNKLIQERIQKSLRCSINGVNSLAQWGALAAIQGPRGDLPAMRQEYQHRRDLFCQTFAKIPGTELLAPPGGFFAWVTLDPRYYAQWGVHDADGLCLKLAEKGVGSAPGDAFGTHPDSLHALRFSFSCDTNMVKEGLEMLKQILGAP